MLFRRGQPTSVSLRTGSTIPPVGLRILVTGAIDEKVYGPEHPKVAIRVNNLGLVLRAQGDLAGARAAFERAMEIFRKFLPADHANILIVAGNLASLEKEAGEKG